MLVRLEKGALDLVEPTLEDAVILAALAHRGRTDKAGKPYLLHLVRVMLRMDTEEEMMAAVLHDLVEDTGHSLEDLRRAGYPERVVEAVDLLTHRDEDSYEQFIDRASGHPLARQVKLADLEDNLDCRRLPDLKDGDARRLNKYLRAWNRLKGEAS